MDNNKRLTTEDYAEQLFTNLKHGDYNNGTHHSRNSAAYNLNVRRAVDSFLCDNKLLTRDAMANLNNESQSNRYALISMEGFNGDVQLNSLGASSFSHMLDKADITDPYQREQAMKAICVLLAKCKICHGDNSQYRMQHFVNSARDKIDVGNLQHSINTVFAPSLHGNMVNTGVPSAEAFGANIDNVLPDIRSSIGVTLMQFHRGILDRIVPRRTAAKPYIRYVVPYTEVYDMLKSNDEDSKVRNEGDHIRSFIELYGDPKSVSNTLQLIVPLVSNDTGEDGAKLHSDGIVKFNVRANLFDLSRLSNQFGKTHFNYTDLVSENVQIDSVVINLHNGSDDELFQIPLAHVNNARLNMIPNANDSGIRATVLTHTVRLTKNTKTMSGVESKILAKCTDTDYIKLDLHMAATINLKYSDVQAIGSAVITPYTTNRDAAVLEEVQNLVKDTTVTMVGYSVDARYSEENLRKSNLALRYHTRTFDFEISNGRNIMVDHSMEEPLPEFIMSLISEATSLGQDHRGLDVIVKELMHVFDVTNLENKDPVFRSRLDKVGFQYISAQLVRPVVYLSSIDLSDVDNLRSGDKTGDIRGYMEWTLLNLISLVYQNSYYKHQLRPGEKPVFKVVTSSVILENLFSIPHYHNHLNTEEPTDGAMVEYRRVLSNGTILDCITCTYDYMRDKILCIPWRQDDPEDILNWGHNWDFGTFVAHYNPQHENAVNKRLFSNSRTQLIPTCPIGLYIDVRNISAITNMNALTAPAVDGTELPSPSDFIGFSN